MHSNEVRITVENLVKKYRLFGHPGDRIKQALTLGRVKFHRDFTSLNNVSFDVGSGERIGIVGQNGSGKSTLLQLVCGILKPTSGMVNVNGRIAALLELGAGFNPEFTGRENVYFQGAVMGLTRKQIDSRFSGIVDFADIGDFIDQPVRIYSSGMFVRLAFSAMVHTDADILVIDEALAVGDEAFQRKCFDKLADYLEGNDKILLFVSHNIRQIERICSKVIWLDKGCVKEVGEPASVCSAYQRKIQEYHQSRLGSEVPRPNIAYSGEIDVNSMKIYSTGYDMPGDQFEMHSSIRIVVEFQAHVELQDSEIIVGIHTTDSVFIAASSTAMLSKTKYFSPGNHQVECFVPDLMLLPGVYQFRLAVFDRFRRGLWVGHRLCSFRVVAPPDINVTRVPDGLVDLPFEWKLDD
jgi:ABC-type polysaccharide/polyol phosphate transport system ATPase subunit